MEQKIKSKGAKKSFYDVEAPLTSAKISLYGSSAEEFEGRVITLDLTKNLRGKSLELRMRIKNEEGKLKAYPISANISGSYIRRSIRRGTDYIEDSFKANCRDAILIIKPFLITRRRVSRSVRSALRINARKFIESYVKIRIAKELFSDIIANKLQRGIASKLKKIYPLGMSEIRVFEILKEKPLEEIKEEDKKLIEEQIQPKEETIIEDNAKKNENFEAVKSKTRKKKE